MGLLRSILAKKYHYAKVQYYETERMERIMHECLFAPMHVWRDSLKYILATVAGKLFPWCKVTEEQVQRVHDKMLNYITWHCDDEVKREMYLDGLARMWPALKQKMLANRGLWKMMDDSGAKSLSFAKFPVELVPRAIALESAYGVNYDNAGVYQALERVPDLSMRSAAVEPEFVELRRRGYFANDCIMRHIPELKRYLETPAAEKLGTVVTTGAGLLVELRKYGMTLAQLQSLRVIACDMDQTLLKELDVVCRHDFGVPFAETGIEYRFCAIDQFLDDLYADETVRGKVNVVLMDGVLSYCQSVDQVQRYLQKATRLCDPANSVVFCDLTVLEISLLRCAIVQGWQVEDKAYAMHPELTAKAAVRKMRRICKNLGLAMSYAIDPRNPSPLGVIFWINDTHLRNTK